MNDPVIIVVPREAVEHRVRKSKVTLTERSRADDELHDAIKAALADSREDQLAAKIGRELARLDGMEGPYDHYPSERRRWNGRAYSVLAVIEEGGEQ